MKIEHKPNELIGGILIGVSSGLISLPSALFINVKIGTCYSYFSCVLTYTFVGVLMSAFTVWYMRTLKKEKVR